MSFDVHLHVCFNCSENKGVAALAAKHLSLLKEQAEKEFRHEVVWFLEDLSKRTGANLGPKGGLSLWGTVGNYTRAEEFAEMLRQFWLDLLSSDLEGGPCDHEHVVILFETEQSEQAHAIEIKLTDPDSYEPKELMISKPMPLPFCWNQF